MSFNIEVEGGKTVKLPTAGKYCDRDILVTAAGGGYTEDDLQAKYDEGVQAEYDRFWDAYQENGNRRNYALAFAGSGWTRETFKPKYDLILSGSAERVFAYGSLAGVDLADLLDSYGLVLDTSKCTSFLAFTNYNAPSRFPTIDTRSAANLANFLYYSTVRVIDKIILKDDGSQDVDGMFLGASQLSEVRFEGVIGKTKLSTQWATGLSKDSIVSIVNALSSTTSGLSVTFSKTAVNTAFATTTGGTDGSTSAEWTALVQTKTNWTINLV